MSSDTLFYVRFFVCHTRLYFVQEVDVEVVYRGSPGREMVLDRPTPGPLCPGIEDRGSNRGSSRMRTF